jgi:hypothetical protein
VVAGLAASIILDRIEAQWVTESSRDPWLLAGVVAALAVRTELVLRGQRFGAARNNGGIARQ